MVQLKQKTRDEHSLKWLLYLEEVEKQGESEKRGDDHQEAFQLRVPLGPAFPTHYLVQWKRLITCIYSHVCARACPDAYVEWLLSFRQLGPGDWTQMGKHDALQGLQLRSQIASASPAHFYITQEILPTEGNDLYLKYVDFILLYWFTYTATCRTLYMLGDSVYQTMKWV